MLETGSCLRQQVGGPCSRVRGERGRVAAEFCRRLRFCLREFRLDRLRNRSRAIASRLHGCMVCMMQRKRTTATAGEAAAANTVPESFDTAAVWSGSRVCICCTYRCRARTSGMVIMMAAADPVRRTQEPDPRAYHALCCQERAEQCSLTDFHRQRTPSARSITEYSIDLSTYNPSRDKNKGKHRRRSGWGIKEK